MKKQPHYSLKSNAYLATSVATMFGMLSINVATAQSDTSAEANATVIDMAACQALSDSTALDSESIATRMSCYSRDVEQLNQLVNQLMSDREQLITQAQDDQTQQDTTTEGYKQELADRQDSMQRLEERAAMLSEQIDEVTDDRNQLREQLSGLLSEGKNRTFEAEANNRLYESFSNSYLTLTTEIIELQNKLKEFETVNTELLELKAAQAEQTAQLQSQIATLEQTVSELNADKAQLEANIADANNQVNDMNSQMADNAATAQEQLTQIAELEDSLKSSEEERLKLKENIDSLNQSHLAAITDLNGQATTLNDQILALEIRQQSITAQAQSDSEGLQASIDERDAEVAKLTTRQQQLNAQREALILNITSLEASHLEQTQGFKEQASDLETQITSLTSDATALSGEIETQKLANEELKTYAKESDEKSAELNLLATDLRDQLSNANTKIDSANSEIEMANGKIKAANATIENANSDMETASAKIEIANAEMEIANAKIEIGNVVKLALQEEAEKTNQQNEATLASLKSDSDTLKSLLEMSRAHSKNADATLTELRTEMDASEERLREKQNELQALLAEKAQIEDNFKAIASQSIAQAESIQKTLLDAGHENVKVAVSESNYIGVLLGSGQLFRTGSAQLSSDGRSVLTDLAETFAETQNRRILISGHSDNVSLGDKLRELYRDNWGLSMARALATANFLTEETGIAAERITVSGFGDTQPISSNETAEGRQQNRRVEIQLAPLDDAQVASAN